MIMKRVADAPTARDSRHPAAMRWPVPRRVLAIALALLAIALLGFASLAIVSHGREPPPEARRVLANGLTVIVEPLPGATGTALVVLFDVGDDHDPPGESGLGHVLEHVYVTAAAGDRPRRTADEAMRSHPLGANAQTGAGYTVVASVFPAAALEDELADAAARMGNLSIAQVDLDRERPRVRDELHNMYEAMPALAAMNLARAAARPPAHGGRRGGVAAEVDALGLGRIEERWRALYKPANATVVVAGDVDPAAVMARVEARFAGLPSGVRAPSPPPASSAAAARLLRAPGAPAACAALGVPPPADAGFAATVAAAAVLARAGASRGIAVRVAPRAAPARRFVCASVAAGAAAEATAARLDAFVASSLAGARGAGPAALEQYGPLLGAAPWPAAALTGNVYGVAFARARREQTGVDGAALARAFESLPDADVKAIARRWAAERVVVVAGAP